MPDSVRFPIFLTVVLLIWTALNFYALRHIAALPVVRAHAGVWPVRIAGILLWLSFPVARALDHSLPFDLSRILDIFGSTWVGVLFLLCVCLFASDVVTGFGRFLPAYAPRIRGYAVLLALSLSVIATIQALRPPAVTNYEIGMKGLPKEKDGTVIVLVTDLHLGTILTENWFSGIVDRVEALKPDVVVIGGDLVDGNVRRVAALVPALRRLTAPLGVYAVTGNHEFIAGVNRSVRVLREAGYRVLRDEAVKVAPGLVFAGVDDLTSRSRMTGGSGTADPLAAALDHRPAGATVLLSHSPMRAEEAARKGVGLMLSGHTHAGQIWPFRYVSELFYPLQSGRYDIDGMPVLVCRGTGTWGPRMRLWRRSEIIRITLRSK